MTPPAAHLIPPARPPIPGRTGFRTLLILVTCLTFLLLLGVMGVTSVFRLGKDARVLRDALVRVERAQGTPGVTVHAGPMLLGLARAGMVAFDAPIEARIAARAVREAEVQVLPLPHLPGKPRNPAALLQAADTSMARRGWERAVGVIEDGTVVAIYLPKNLQSTERLKVCLTVLDGETMVVGAASVAMEPLFDLVQRLTQQGHAGLLPPRQRWVQR